MADWIAFWSFFDLREESWPVDGWRIGKGNRLVDARKGDNLWLITSGEKAKWRLPDAVPYEAYLPEIMTIERTIPEREGRFDYLIEAAQDGYHKIDPPLPVDHCVRPATAEPDRAIGAFFQGGKRLVDHVLDALKKELKRHCRDLYDKLYRE
jgi:hypothetical protein